MMTLLNKIRAVAQQSISETGRAPVYLYLGAEAYYRFQRATTPTDLRWTPDGPEFMGMTVEGRGDIASYVVIMSTSPLRLRDGSLRALLHRNEGCCHPGRIRGDDYMVDFEVREERDLDPVNLRGEPDTWF